MGSAASLMNCRSPEIPIFTRFSTLDAGSFSNGKKKKKETNQAHLEAHTWQHSITVNKWQVPNYWGLRKTYKVNYWLQCALYLGSYNLICHLFSTLCKISTELLKNGKYGFRKINRVALFTTTNNSRKLHCSYGQQYTQYFVKSAHVNRFLYHDVTNQISNLRVTWIKSNTSMPYFLVYKLNRNTY